MLLVANGTVITLGKSCKVIENGAVAVEGDIIKEVGKTAELRQKYSDAEYIDAEGRLIMPGMINTHMHFYSTFARGLALPEPPANFVEILEKLWWKLDKKLTLEDVYYSALIPLIDCIKNGTTTVFDHHASFGAITGSLDEINKACTEAGLRTCLCYEVSDREGKEKALESIEENRRFIKKCQENDDPMTKATFGLHASLTLSPETLAKCAEVASELGIGVHIHTAEGIRDVEDSLDKYGMRVVERLRKYELLGPRTIAAHCVHVNDDEIRILAETDTNVVHNPESNMGNAVGCAPVIKMLKNGVRVGMGTDGFTSDMFEGIKVANVLHKHDQGDPSASWAEVPRMIFENNSAIVKNFYDKPLGVLEPGAYADIITIDYNPATPLTADSFYPHLLFGVSGAMVNTTIVAGKVLMQDRKLKGIDEKEVAAKARELAAKLWERF
ncbi:MAG: hypothetical protein PWQ96_1242 [Clostridia bacterium]|jgi:putative selenium metabolism protein SsnA|nr:putative selenium metabolism protein SsnA [Clostridiales bacterium]MDK2985600.1 hypothetical protein [Clostridia bacterium]